MTEISRFFDSSAGDRVYNAQDFADLFQGIASEGVVSNVVDSLKVIEATPVAMNVKVSPGSAWVQGRFYGNDGLVSLAVSSSHATLDRKDRVVLRLDLTARTLVAALKLGTASLTPATPALTQNSSTWEIALATVNVAASAVSIDQADIEDERGFSQFWGATEDVGVVKMFAGTSAPYGWLLCDGAAISRADFDILFGIVGTTYGPGNGTTTFNLPDFRGRAPIGSGAGAGLTARASGAALGEETHALSTGELASHGHTVSDPTHNHSGSQAAHGHGVTDGGHGHGLTDPGHGHGISDPTHLHGTDLIQTGGGPAQIVGSGGVQTVVAGNSAAAATGVTVDGNTTGASVDGAGTGVSIQNSTPGVTVDAGATGVTVQNATPGVTVDAAATGVTTQAAGSGTAHNNMQPSLAIPFIIKAA